MDFGRFCASRPFFDARRFSTALWTVRSCRFLFWRFVILLANFCVFEEVHPRASLDALTSCQWHILVTFDDSSVRLELLPPLFSIARCVRQELATDMRDHECLRLGNCESQHNVQLVELTTVGVSNVLVSSVSLRLCSHASTETRKRDESTSSQVSSDPLSFQKFLGVLVSNIFSTDKL